jgi:hypothetical protein
MDVELRLENGILRLFTKQKTVHSRSIRTELVAGV